MMIKKFATGLICLLASITTSVIAQKTFPENGIASPSEKSYAFTNATIVKDSKTTLTHATMIIRKGRIVAIGNGISVPADVVAINCSGKFIYPSFIDLYSDYGITLQPRPITGFTSSVGSQLLSNTPGSYGWNQAVKPEVNASEIFTADDAKAKPIRENGFGTVLTHLKDGIARGTGSVVSLANMRDNFVMLKEKASSHFSFSKGTSTQAYPESPMGSIALLRQTYLDAEWYKNKPATEGVNLSLQAWNDIQNLPQIFEANDKWACIRADRIGDEFNVQYILKAGGNEYQRINDVAATKASFIVPLNFPVAIDVDDPNDARYVRLADLKHWEMAVSNPSFMEKANIKFAFTQSDLPDPKQFLPSLRKAIGAGLSEKRALEALTETPALMIGIYSMVGSLDNGKLANFLITTGPVFNEKTLMLENWVQGEKYSLRDDEGKNIAGTYNLVINAATGTNNYVLEVNAPDSANVIGRDTLTTRFIFDGKLVRINFDPVAAVRKRTPPDSSVVRDTPIQRLPPGNIPMDSTVNRDNQPPDDRMPPQQNIPPDRVSGRQTDIAIQSGPSYRLSGTNNGNTWHGNGVDTAGNPVLWTATLIKTTVPKTDTTKRREPPKSGTITYPFGSYGWETMPKQEDILIRNATVWTNESDGILQKTDVLVRNGKIAQVGKGLTAGGAKVIDGTGQYLTPGIIDEHSHIGTFSVNEGGQTVTSEVRIGDNLNPEDINIYRQLSGGVTTSHILHGSANTIGGQTQLIKLRWGANDNDLKFGGNDPFIKFALGENVKRTTSSNNNRFPDTRMGVQEVLVDAFTRARDYEKARLISSTTTRRDLELDALVEIMNKKRFITCHSYVQSEIIAAMRVGEKFGFTFNTFTHILEGYKVADKMKQHGAAASTFSDWWSYKVEVQDAIPQNPAIMHRMGINVAINSDDAEMARRLNQEAAKSIKYAGMNEIDAFKMVTINPAKMMHIDSRVGSIKVGKDADLVLWNDHPLSIYAKALKTMVDGIVYFDRDRDLELRKKISQERNRIIQKMLGERQSGNPTVPAVARSQEVFHCEDDE